MTTSASNFFHRETIEGAQGPCPAYSGMISAVETFNGKPIIVMAASMVELLDVIREINPNVKPNPALCMPASVIHDQYIKRKDNEL
jgi:hypothetical protein